MAEEATPVTALETPTAANEAQPETLLNPPQDPTGETTTDPAPAPTTEPEKVEKPVVPEKYDFTLPEGTTLDQASLDAFTPLAKELGLSQEAAQKLVNFELGRAKDQQESLVKMQETWLADFKADQEFGGAKEVASLKAANAAYKQFFTPEEIKAVKETGLSNFPPLVKALTRIGRLMAEGEFVLGDGASKEKEGNMFLPGSKRT